MNAANRSYTICNFSLIVSTLPDKNKKTHKTAHFEVSHHSILLLNSKKDLWAKWAVFYKLLINSFSSLAADNLLLYKQVYDQNNFIFKISYCFIETKVNFHDLQCDALMTSPTDLRTLTKYIVKYSFLIPLVQLILKLVKKRISYSPK